MTKKIETVIYYRNTLIRKSLKLILSSSADLIIVGEAKNKKELFNFLELSLVEVVLVCVDNALFEGKELFEAMRFKFPNTKGILLGVQSDMPELKTAISWGVRACVDNECLPEDLIDCIKQTHNYGFSFDRLELENVLFKEKGIKPTLNKDLSAREIEILKGLYGGKTEKEIAMKLNISVNTVHFHKKNLYIKTKSHNLADVLRFARENSNYLLKV